MNYKKMLVGDHLAAVELDDKQPTLTIAAIKPEMMDKRPKPGEKQDPKAPKKKQKKWIVFFREMERGWVLNKTNTLCLAAMFGEETDQWIGKRVTICAEMVRVGPKVEPGIRIKGSPDLTEPVFALIEMPMRAPVRKKLVPTVKGVKVEDETATAPVDDETPLIDLDNDQPEGATA